MFGAKFRQPQEERRHVPRMRDKLDGLYVDCSIMPVLCPDCGWRAFTPRIPLVYVLSRTHQKHCPARSSAQLELFRKAA